MRATLPLVNFRNLGASRPRLAPGDVFVMQIPDGTHLFGRLVRTDASCFGPNCVLVYVFSYRSPSPEPPPQLLVQDLLIAPVCVNRLGWSRGYFRRVGHRPFRAGERLAQHYFKDSQRQRFVEEDRRPLPTPPPGTLVGQSGLGNYRTLDDQVSDALGIPRVPD